MILTNSDKSDVPVLGEGEEIQCEVSVSLISIYSYYFSFLC